MIDFGDLFFENLEKSGVFIDRVYREIIKKRLDSIISYQPMIGIFGKTGAGKSSLCNALFGQDVCEISDISACTRAPQEVILSMGNKGIKLIDVPGVGESVERDKEYEDLYKNLLPELDVVLWVLKGDDRAFSSDEIFYKNLVKPYIDKGRPFFIVLNQVDKIEPFREWDVAKNRPGAHQAENIEAKRRNVASIFDLPLNSVIPISANERYGLIELVDNIVHSLPKERKAILLKEVKEENRSSGAKQEAKNGFVDTLTEILTNLFTSPTAVNVIKAGVDVLKAGVSKLFSKIFGW